MAGLDVEHLERAVMLVLDPSSEQVDEAVREEADEFCTRVHGDPEAWRPCLGLFLQTTQPLVRFFCLQVVEGTFSSGAYAALTPDQRAEVRTALLDWARTSAASGVLGAEGAFVLNKLALVFVLMVRADFPHTWPGAFADLRAALGEHEATLDLYLRVLGLLDDEVVAYNTQRPQEETQHNAAIKDAMRLPGCLDAIVDHWFELVSVHGGESPELAAKCLRVMQKYVDWIAIDLVVTERWLSLLFDLLGDVNLRVDACGCISRCVAKGMDHGSKLELLRHMRIVDVLGDVVIPPAAELSDDTCDEDFYADIAELTSDVGIQLLQCWQHCSLRPDESVAEASAFAAAQARRIVTQAIALLRHDSRQIAEEVLPLANTVLSLLKKELLPSRRSRGGSSSASPDVASPGFRGRSRALSGAATAFSSPASDGPPVPEGGAEAAALSMQEFVPPLLETAAMRIEYPAEWFSSEEEQVTHDKEFREPLVRVVVNMTRILPGATLELLTTVFAPRIASLGELAWNEAELLLSLVYAFGEGVAAALGDHTAPGSDMFAMVCDIHASNVAAHDNPLVLTVYYDVAVRYHAVFTARPELLPRVLEAMLGGSGLRNGDAHVRARSAYMLLRLVKTFADVAEIASGVTSYILDGVQEFLEIPFAAVMQEGGSLNPTSDAEPGALSNLLGVDEQEYLYEVVGLLVGAVWMPVSERATYLEGAVRPLLEQLEEGLLRVSSMPADAAEGVSEWTVRVLGAIGHLTKGVRGTAGDALGDLLEQVMGGAMAAASALPGQPGVRSKVYFLLHRMVECMAPERLVPLLGPCVPVFLGSATLASLPELLTLVQQGIARLNTAMAPIVEAHIVGISRAVWDAMPPADVHERSDDHQERLALQRSYFAFIQYIPLYGLAGVLLSDGVAPYLEEMLGSVVVGAVSVPEMPVRKACFVTLRYFVEWWVPPGKADADASVTVPLDGDMLDAFIAFVWESVAPGLFEVALTADFNLNDAQCSQVAQEACALQALLTERLDGADGRPDFLGHLVTTVLPAHGCPPEEAAAYAAGVRANLASQRALKRGYLQLAENLRQANGVA